ncbi:MAG: hypothetical protein KAQ65_09655 [Candidatus Thorarchaeota archaeon]|nr:hypothetical protein [Candidatus Thorarchaeota archaeon]
MYVDDSDLVEPIHAESFFSVASSGEIHERLSFEYLDPEGHYRTIISDENLLSKEIRKLSTNMQHFLDLERVEINSERVASIVRYTDIFPKGASNVVAVMYLIDFGGKLHPGGNKIQTWLEIESAPYDFEIIWRFPVGTQIVDIDTKLEYDIYRDLVVLWAEEGMEVGGYELMEFILPEFPLDTRVKSNDSV